MDAAVLEYLARKVSVGLCWEWRGKPSQYGYGRARVDTQLWLAHRWVWTVLVGPIPEGMTLDHLCRNHICVNPDHLEVVTLAENKRRGYSPPAINARKATCKRGHDMKNPLNKRRGRGGCAVCHRMDERERRSLTKEG
jgi:hypothetical protein